MKVCIPVQENKGLDSIVYDHFGSAPMFLIYDTESSQIKEIQNGDLHHVHGKCQPIRALHGETVDALLVGGIGAAALMKLNSQGVKAYKLVNGTLAQNIELLKNRQLSELTVTNCCNHHKCTH